MSKSTTTKNLKYISASHNLLKVLFVLALLAALFIPSQKKILPTAFAADSIWEIRSIDTMKTSRDMARAELDNPTFDETIKKEISLIKELGANYVAIGTPYDDEFLPYLERWVREIRARGLKVWYRGTFSGYEGWFEYKKNISPDQLLLKTSAFIADHPDLFVEGDIFDPCPECENGGYWKQPQDDKAYNTFMMRKHDALKAAFEGIDKKVIYNLNSVIGGRAKDVLKKETFDYLGNVIAIDHYAKPASNYENYVNYFADNFNTKVVFSEIGAPIPDIHGKMTGADQAKFMRDTFNLLYKNRSNVGGINYWVLTEGTTALYNAQYEPLEVVEVIKDYYRPAIVNGQVLDTLQQPIEGLTVTTSDGGNVVTDSQGRYQFAMPQGEKTIEFKSDEYKPQQEEVTLSRDEHITINIQLEPEFKTIFYILKERIYQFSGKLLL